jgi:hypothetical protein
MLDGRDLKTMRWQFSSQGIAQLMHEVSGQTVSVGDPSTSINTLYGIPYEVDAQMDEMFRLANRENIVAT